MAAVCIKNRENNLWENVQANLVRNTNKNKLCGFIY